VVARHDVQDLDGGVVAGRDLEPPPQRRPRAGGPVHPDDDASEGARRVALGRDDHHRALGVVQRVGHRGAQDRQHLAVLVGAHHDQAGVLGQRREHRARVTGGDVVAEPDGRLAGKPAERLRELGVHQLAGLGPGVLDGSADVMHHRGRRLGPHVRDDDRPAGDLPQVQRTVQGVPRLLRAVDADDDLPHGCASSDCSHARRGRSPQREESVLT